MVIKAIETAKKAYEETLIYTADVIVRTTVKDAKTKVTKETEKTLLKGIPCRLSFAGSSTSDDGDTYSANGSMTLMTKYGVNIPANSKITVEQEGTVYTVTNSKVKVYKTHFSYPVTEFIRWL